MEPSHRSKSHVVLDVLGPTVEFLVLPSESEDRYCVLKGTIPPEASVPLHSHPDDQSFFLLSGVVQALEQGQDGFEEVTMNEGDFRHVPQQVRHAWKNRTNELAVAVIVTTSRLRRFFQEVERPIAADRFQSLHLSRIFSVSPTSLLATTIGSPARRKTRRSGSTYWDNSSATCIVHENHRRLRCRY
jgi:quercetin dioxygenase-like cupin family protein